MLPEASTVNLLELLTLRSRRLPAKPEALFRPRPVPLVDQVVEVVPEGSMSSWGLVVVDVPPENQVPERRTEGVEVVLLARNVLEPAKLCVPVVTTPRAVAEASGRLKVYVPLEEEMPKSVPEVPVAKLSVPQLAEVPSVVRYLPLFPVCEGSSST
jgi:hypothetical protein